MLLLVLAFLGGILTILSPCILPVLPFVFAKADKSFRRSGLPLLAGMGLTFAGFAAIAGTGGAWLVRANQYGRIAAMVAFTLVGLTLLLPSLADRLSRPAVALGAKLSQPSSGTNGKEDSISRSLLLGVATGLLWAPCAGPILGLILTGAALGGASTHTALLLIAYAGGAVTSLGVALFAGGRVYGLLKRSLGAEAVMRRILGVAVLLGVVAIAFGFDRGVLTQISLSSTSGIEQSLINRLRPPSSTQASADDGVPKTMPELSGAALWINSQPLDRAALKGHVVLIDFWTYSCINCLRTIPYIKAWDQKYRASGLIVIGVHTPEFAFEKDAGNVRRAVKELGIAYPVPLDNDYKIWEAFNNSYWPADYLIDSSGRVRHHQFGEGGYDETEKAIQALLKEDAGASFNGLVNVSASGAEAASGNYQVKSFETYIGYERAEHMASPGGIRQDMPSAYSAPAHLELNQWGLVGQWTDHSEVANLDAPHGRIVFRFDARDLHLVLGSATEGKSIPFRVTIDDRPPGANHGADTDERGEGRVTEHRLYQLIRQTGAVEDHTFEIEFLDSGVQAFSFTFG